MKKMMKKFKNLKNERGLTLVELLAVVVILGIIGTIAFVYIGGVIDNSKKDAHIANAQQIISAAKLYDVSGGNMASGAMVTSEALQNADYLDVLIDPWDTEEYDNDATVTKAVADAGDGTTTTYSIEFDNNKGDCTLNTSELGLTSGDRDKLCDGEDPTTTTP